VVWQGSVVIVFLEEATAKRRNNMRVMPQSTHASLERFSTNFLA